MTKRPKRRPGQGQIVQPGVAPDVEFECVAGPNANAAVVNMQSAVGCKTVIGGGFSKLEKLAGDIATQVAAKMATMPLENGLPTEQIAQDSVELALAVLVGCSVPPEEDTEEGTEDADRPEIVTSV
tara:strand:- start:22945 stop:23322 length:378 start_codon:yes stop_codon:yes gene_type:complete